MATCRDLLYNSAVHNLVLLGGKNGLDRVITWPYTIIARPIKPWVNGGELGFYYGAGMDNSKEGLIRLIEEACDSNLSGLVILVGDTYVTLVPDDVIETADRLDLPLFITQTASYITTMQQAIMSFINGQEQLKLEKAEFWSSLFFGDNSQDLHFLYNKAHYFGIDPLGKYCVYILRFQNLEAYVEQNRKDEMVWFLNDFLDTVNKKTDYYVSGTLPEVWTLPRQKDFIVVSPVSSVCTPEKTGQTLSRLVGKLEASYPGSEFAIGRGLPFKNITNIRQSYIQARRSLQVLHNLNGKIADYADIGFLKILFEVNSRSILEDYIRDTILLLEKRQKEVAFPLLETLEAYLNCRGNVSGAAASLYLHRNTMIQRLGKIEAILDADLSDNNTFYNLQISMMVYRYLNDSDEEGTEKLP
ncbi:MAG: PucR family transcriptional regulator [Fusicatenibacter sp.]